MVDKVSKKYATSILRTLQFDHKDMTASARGAKCKTIIEVVDKTVLLAEADELYGKGKKIDAQSLADAVFAAADKLEACTRSGSAITTKQFRKMPKLLRTIAGRLAEGQHGKAKEAIMARHDRVNKKRPGLPQPKAKRRWPQLAELTEILDELRDVKPDSLDELKEQLAGFVGDPDLQAVVAAPTVDPAIKGVVADFLKFAAGAEDMGSSKIRSQALDLKNRLALAENPDLLDRLRWFNSDETPPSTTNAL